MMKTITSNPNVGCAEHSEAHRSRLMRFEHVGCAMRTIIKKSGAHSAPYLLALLMSFNSYAADSYTVQLQTQPTILQVDALVEAEQAVTISAQANGTVEKVLVDAGSRVKTGQLLLSIDNRSSSQAQAANQAQLAALETQLAQAKADLERAKQQLAIQAISQADFEHAQTHYQTTQAQLTAQQAQLKQSQIQLGYSEVTSPANLVISQKLVNAGDLVTLGKPLFTAFNPDRLRIVAHIPQQYRNNLNSSAKVQAGAQWLTTSNLTVLPSADAATHSFEVRANLNGKSNIAPGMYVKLHLTTGQQQQLTIPQTAILKRSEVTAVYVLSKQGPQLRQIRTGATDAQGNVVVLSGLTVGEQISLSPLTIKK